MHRKLFLLIFLTIFIVAEDNKTEGNITKDANNTVKEVEENIKKAIEAEKKFATEQKFYQGDEYNLSEHEVDQKSVEKVPLIEPEYDFDITDLYAD